MHTICSSTLVAVARPTVVLVAAVALFSIADWTLKIVALIDLSKRPDDAVRFRVKWAWAIGIVLVNFVGSILYLALGRLDVEADDDADETAVRRLAAGDRARAAVDVLYGPRPVDPPPRAEEPER